MKPYVELDGIVSNVTYYPLPHLSSTLESLKYFKNYRIIE